MQPFLSPAQAELLAAELRFQSGIGARASCPKAAIHGDLFRDNVLFAGDRVAGIIDFGFAATDFLAYDLAIAVNDWCNDADGELDAGAHRRVHRRATSACARSRRTSASSGRRSCARPRCASGCRASTTSTCRAPASSCTRTIPRAFERILARRVAAMPAAARRARRLTPMSDARATSSTRVHEASKGVAWLKDAWALFSRARMPWLFLLATYYVVMMAVDLVPFVGPARGDR